MNLLTRKTITVGDIKMKKEAGPRLFPKMKGFVNGEYFYNPIITKGSLKTWEGLIADYTNNIAEELVNTNPYRIRMLGRLITMRARCARIRASDKKKLLKFKG